MDNKNWNVKAIENFASLSEMFDDIHWDTKNGGLSMTAKKDGQFVFGMGVLADGNTASCVPARVIYRDDTTVAIFPDGTKTTSRPMGDDEYDKEVGLAMCIAKRVCGGRKAFLEVVENAEIQYEKPVKKKKQTHIDELKAPYEAVAHKPYWHELDNDTQNLLRRMLHSGHSDMIDVVKSYANPSWCTCPAGVWSVCGCHALRDGFVNGKDAIICCGCHFYK